MVSDFPDKDSLHPLSGLGPSEKDLENARLWREIEQIADLPVGIEDPKDLPLAAGPAPEEDAELEQAWQALASSGLLAPAGEALLADDFFDETVDSDAEDEAAEDLGTHRSSSSECAVQRNYGAGTLGQEAAGSKTSLAENPIIDPAKILALAEAQRQKAEEVYAQILSRAPEHKIQPSLERVERVLEILGNPQNTYRTIHVTGTNGKTSTTRITECLLREAGLTTGLYTSPHLNTPRERICLNGEPISESEFLYLWEEVSPFIELVDQENLASGGARLSFFEVFTVLAYTAFANAAVDVAVIEVGMGGRWDATNVINPDVAILTPVALDHQKWLGSTVEEIAEEKVGIIKPGCQTISAQQNETVAQIITDKALSVGPVPPIFLGQQAAAMSTELAVGGQLVSLRTPQGIYTDLFVPLYGRYQADNVCLAVCAVESFFGHGALDADLLSRGLNAVTSPGRLELVRRSPAVVVDAGHNPHGVEATLEALDEAFGFTNLTVVYSAMADKDIETVLGLLEAKADNIVLVEMPDNPRAAKLEDLTDIAVDVFGEDRVETADNVEQAVVMAVNLAEGPSGDPADQCGVLVIGSVVLAGQVRALFKRGY